MCKIILPIKPKYSQDILSNKKIFELRRKLPKKKIDKVFIYETSPTMKIVGEFTVKKVHKEKLSSLWDKTMNSNSVIEDEFYSYFNNLDEGFAIEVDEIKKYDIPKTLSEFGKKSAPQGYIYV